MAQNFWTAICAFSICFVVTIVVSLVTTPRDRRELVGLVYSLTEKPREPQMAWYLRPAALGVDRAHRDAAAQRGVLLMPLDIRIPIGAMLGLMGLLLAGYGLSSAIPRSTRDRSA